MAFGKMVGERIKNAICILAIAFSFLMYVASFEPFGAAEFAYIFAIPAILVARISFFKIQTSGKFISQNARAFGNDTTADIATQTLDEKKLKKSSYKVWLITTFLCSYFAWVAILVWLRHVYYPAGIFAMIALPLIISALFIFPWFALLPKLLPNLTDSPFSRIVAIGGLSGAWVLLEWFRSFLFSGFPWLLLAHSQWQRPAAIQYAEFGGTWIVSFFIIFFNLAAAEYIWRIYARQKFRMDTSFSTSVPFSRFCPEIYIAAFAIMGGLFVYVKNLPSPVNQYTAFRAGMVQPDFAGILKWEDSMASENLRVVSTLTSALKNARVDIALLPEAATPPRYPIIGSQGMKEWFELLAKKTGAPILTGNMAYLWDEQSAQNGVFVISNKTGLQKDYYAKKKLVPFGEYVPNWCKFIGKVVPVGNMKRGEVDKPLDVEIANKNYKVGTMICYEDIFSELGRTMVNNGADILFVCTNDSWYGREGGAWQHAAHSALQAVSLRKPLMRASNNGLSAIFDQYGRMRPSFVLKDTDGMTWDASNNVKISPIIDVCDSLSRPIDAQTLKPKRPSPLLDNNGSIYFRGAGYSDVVFYKNFDGKTTLYAQWGDWFVGLAAILFFISLFNAYMKCSKKKLEVVL